MPTYEYACSSCANEWEAEQSIREDALKECPRCHQQTARRQISRGTGFILKGSGWYSDLYSSSSNKKEPSGSSGAGETKGGESKTGESKAGGESTTSDGGGGSKGDSSGSSDSTPKASSSVAAA